MAQIRPLKAWRFNSKITSSIEELTSPLFYVVSDRQRKALYSNEINSIHLSVPEGPKSIENAVTAMKLGAYDEYGKHGSKLDIVSHRDTGTEMSFSLETV